MSDRVRKLIGIEAINAERECWTGQDEVIAIIDSGIDPNHPDFGKDRVQTMVGVAGGRTDDIIGHGTHVAGIAAGDGTASDGRVRGMAPKAGLVVIGMTDDDARLMLPPDLGQLLNQAADAGARIINLSWDFPLASAYDSGSRSVDAFVRQRPDVLVVVAAGNESEGAPDGYPYLYSMGTPATAKNALTVGACASDRPDIELTWGQYNGTRFPTKPTAELSLAGDPTAVAAFSGRGPTDYQSVKPDLVAPGTAILAARSSLAPDSRFWRLPSEYKGKYTMMNGTSMAAPVVSGAAAVVRQYVRQHYNVTPSAALLKAILIAATERLPWQRADEARSKFGFPDFDQGFGRLDLRAVLPHPAAPPGRELFLEDVADEEDKALESRAPRGSVHQAARRYRWTLAESEAPLRIVLTWIDYHEAAVQNCLSIHLRGPAGILARGNDQHRWQEVDPGLLSPKALAMAIDRRNSVQAVEVSPAPAGEYTLTITASNTLFPPQGYSLCVSGAFDERPTFS
ncbi:MAG TPA: S8 family serine peptidase [Jatrophihabitans sp.]|nr:S8 family serine peptidase [Jatrophihabitans sp.]